MRIYLSEIFNLTGSEIYNPDMFRPVTSVSTDTRAIKRNSLFVAIKGSKFDGHKFVYEAVKNGASAILISKRKLNDFDNVNIPIITVPDTIKAYGELASIWRSKFNSKVISITGSNGKTTTKEILATLLSEKYKTEKSLANNNNHIGVPLTILSTKENCEILILEHGTNHFGEIEYTSKIAQPDYSIITNIGDSHLEFLIDREGVYNEKQALLDSTIKKNGFVFVNFDDPIIRKNSRNIENKITFGIKSKCDIKGTIIGFTDDGRTNLKIEFGNKNIDLLLPIYGKSNALNVLAAIAVAQYLKLSIKQIKSGIKKLEQVKGRLYIQKFNSLLLIDDTYNANPASMESAIELVKNIKLYKIKTLIIGDMFELGKQASDSHKNLAVLIKKSKINNVLMVGKLMSILDEELRNTSINRTYFKTRRELGLYIKKNNFTNQVVLIKGSRGMKMEKFVEQIRDKAA